MTELTVFSRSKTQTTPSAGPLPKRPAGEKETPIELMGIRLQGALEEIHAEQEKLRKEGQAGPARSLAFPYVIAFEKTPQEKIRLTNGVNTYLRVTQNAASGNLDFDKYAFVAPDVQAIISQLLTKVGMNPEETPFGIFVRPSGS